MILLGALPTIFLAVLAGLTLDSRWRPRAAPQGACMIEIESLTRTYGEIRAVDGVSLTIDRGELMACVAGLRTPVLARPRFCG